MRNALEVVRKSEAMDTYDTLMWQQASGRYYFSGTPLTAGELAARELYGNVSRLLRPAMPHSADLNKKCFVPHDTQPAVCVSSLASMALFRALSHQTLHVNLPRRQRRSGWFYAEGQPVYQTTAAVMDNIDRMRRAGIWLYSTVVAVRRDAAPFKPFPPQPHQFRSYVPVPFRSAEVATVNLDLWPDNVHVCDPWPEDFDLSAYAPHEPRLDAYLDEMCAQADSTPKMLTIKELLTIPRC